MKKTLLALAFAGFSVAAFAQNYTVIDATSTDVIGTTQYYYVPNGTTDTRIYTVNNVSNSTKSLKVRKTILLLNDAGSSAYFCTGTNCYSPTDVLSYTVTTPAGGNFNLTTDYYSSVSGVSQVRYTVFDINNTADSSTFIINYDNSPAGINANVAVKASVSSPMPNPASSVFNMNYKLGSENPNGAKLVIYNMLGANVMQADITSAEGTVRMDVSSLEQGVYFCSLVADGKTVATRRLVVSH